jgi:hypothetical protein
MKEVSPMKIDWQHYILIFAYPALIAGLTALQGSFSATSVAAMGVGLLISALSAAKPSIFPGANVTAAVKTAATKVVGSMLAVFLFVFMAVTSACGFFTPSQTAVLTADGTALVSCIIGQALSGQTSAAQIGLKCGAPAGFDVLSFVTQFLTTLTAPGDAAVAGAPATPAKAALIDALKAVH